MRIALVAGEDPGWGGIGTYTGVLGTALAELGHEVTLILRGWEEDGVETLDGLAVHRVVVPEPSWRRGTEALAARLYGSREAVLFARGAARAIAQIEPDVVEAPEFQAAGLAAALRARLRRAPPVVVRLHAPSFLTTRLAGEAVRLDGHAVEALEAAAAHAAARVSAPSRAVAEIVGRRWRLPRARVRVIPNPIDEQLFAPVAGAEVAGRIAIVGRLERGKGHDLLMAALPAVRATVPDAHVVAAGDDGGLLADCERLGLGAFTWWGQRPRTELPALYASASVCVVPSRFEAFPYTALEAMACGRPVIATRVGGLPEVTGEAARLVAPEDPAALATALIELLEDSSARARLGAAARRRVLDTFTARKVAAQMTELYTACAG